MDKRRLTRIKLLKKIIVVTFFCSILLPTILCILLFVRISTLSNSIEIIKQELNEVRLQQDLVLEQEQIEVDVEENLVNLETDLEKKLINLEELNKGKKKVYLTFDDGPSNMTAQILDILSQYNVKATFFVTGKEDEASKILYRRIVDEGHTIALHSYSHRYSEIYESEESFWEDINKLQNLLEETVGFRPTIMRFPGGSSNNASVVAMEDLIQTAKEQNFTFFDWNISALDAASKRVKAEEIVKNCTNDLNDYSRAMILMHDANTKDTTVEALPQIIEKILEQENTVILPITEYTEPIHHKTKE